MATPNSQTLPDEWVLTTHDLRNGYHPTFTGNGYMGARVPAAGNGHADAPFRTQFHVAGLYTTHAEGWSRKAGLPAWTSLDVSDGSGSFNGAFAAEQEGDQLVAGDWAAMISGGSVSARGIEKYSQSLDLRTGTITTTARWTSPAGRVTDVRYDVLTDRSRPHVAAVRVMVTPHWAGPLTVTDALETKAAIRTKNTAHGSDAPTLWLTTEAEGSEITAAIATVLQGPEGIEVADARTAVRTRTVDAIAHQPYVFIKFVGIATSHDAPDPLRLAGACARDAESRGYQQLVAHNRRAWDREWAGDIIVHGHPALQRYVRASKFYLLTSVRQGSPWSPSPAGLSSDGYNGHVFWDTETWIWPSLLAQHPGIAESVLDYRVNRMDAARAYAARTGCLGARFPWESGLDGSEDTPRWAPFGRYEHHVTSDVALAFWQYWLATGDVVWLRHKGWPVLREAAAFWVSRITIDDQGAGHINGVISPDEYADEPHDDSVYTNVSAGAVLRFADAAAKVLGEAADPRWTKTAEALVVPFDERLGIHPEFAGYAGQLIKQADVVMLAYPWEHPQSERVTRSDLAYYSSRTHPDGPSMTDSVHSIIHAQLGDAQAAFDYTLRSFEPFIREPFAQFAEDRNGGAFTFLTGHGGLLQEFLYGYSGLRWRADRVILAPVLPDQLDGITLRGLQWQGRLFDVDIRPTSTSLHLRAGAELLVESHGCNWRVTEGNRLTVPTMTRERDPLTQ